MAIRVVRDTDIGAGLAIVADKVVANVDGTTLQLNATDQIELVPGAVAANETAFGGTGSTDMFLSVTPGGTNGHTPSYVFDYSAAAFVEGVQDAVGQAILSGAGITYDDVSDSISSVLGNITFGDGLSFTGAGGTVSVLPNPASPYAISVSPAGVTVTPVASGDTVDGANLFRIGTDSRAYVATNDVQTVAAAAATVELCALDGTVIGNLYP